MESRKFMTDKEEDKTRNTSFVSLVPSILDLCLNRYSPDTCIPCSFHTLGKKFYIFSIPPVHYRNNPITPWGYTHSIECYDIKLILPIIQ